MELYESVAFQLHEAWRVTRKQPDGSYEPRWKKIKDEKFIEDVKAGKINVPYVRVNEEGVYEIDIANASYDQLSADWQEENKQAAIVVAELCEKYKNNELDLDQVGDIIHNAWLERNSWAKDGELGVPFAELPKEEQDKDLVQFKIAFDMYTATKKDFYAGTTIEDAAKFLAKAKELGMNVYVDFNGQRLYSLYDTVDTCYLKVTGKTKEQFERAKEEWRKEYQERTAREEARAKASIPAWYERGKKMIYPQKWDNWYQCVEGRATDLYHGWDLENALEIMEALENGASMEEATAIFEKAGHSGASASMVLKILVNFSKRGVEFYRANCFGEISPQTEEFLQKVTADNEAYAKIEAENAKNGKGKNPKD